MGVPDMNYFPFFADPTLSAVCLDDKRLRRVMAESVTVLSAMQYDLTQVLGPYAAHVPIPRELKNWLATNNKALMWFSHWTRALIQECEYRFGVERVQNYVAVQKWARLSDYLRTGVASPPALMQFINLARSKAKGLDFTDMPSAHEAYRAYVAHQWDHMDVHPPKWSRRARPF